MELYYINLFSKYLCGGVHTRFNRKARNNNECHPIDAKMVTLFPNKRVHFGEKKIDPFILDDKSLSKTHAYLLGHCDEVDAYIRYLNWNIVFVL